ncbi:MAG: hypothetical protein GXP29_06810, partial [Planctomycetes bacterium]|nr:hypothetical protein [Planctomycetota bacterium]
MISHTNNGAAPTDEGMACPSCEYNLTGITSDRCPECGHLLQWEEIRRELDLTRNRPGTHWERYRGLLKPVGFVITALRVAMLPWRFAQELPSRPAIRPAVGFFAICLLVLTLVMVVTGKASLENATMWGAGVICHILLQTILFGLILPPEQMKCAYSFWFVVSAYTSYPLLLEGLSTPPFIALGYSNIWPLSRPDNMTESLPSILYYLWWAGLILIADARMNRRRRK